LVPVFINGARRDVPAGAPLSAVLAEHDPEALALLVDASGAVTDARGLPVDPDTPVHAGAIYRIRRSARRDGVVDA
jgi:hypothetical protein